MQRREDAFIACSVWMPERIRALGEQDQPPAIHTAARQWWTAVVLAFTVQG
ncbi:hypothetical protein ACFOPN_18655 [Xanthomonas hyacinthi]|uniref:hypothetical protein n=1 Tax=Xanthomonas hyacinthi TaxID=56455 RepID=UPI000B2052AB|nr:hypothetical protein [Xanthomonas hyacinthi]